ncbi:DUF2231 domain-containing protein [Flavobacterium sp. WC2421]|jgi:uncharacterized membrane protein|uniref:DUF2231 domain-containing protein n=1 Tax=Flavobacterium sp. WC2409 TaxID=3234139 RepID=A0AB39W7Q7_9FLAO
MNDAHLHLVVNHFPIIGSILGLGVLIAGLFLKNNSVKNTGFFLLIIAAVFALASMATGDGAEEMVKDMPTIGEKIIHEHEQIAEKFALVLYATGIFSIVSLYATQKRNKFAKIVTYITLILALIAAGLSTFVGTSGGEIRHTEIRDNNDTLVSKNINSVRPGFNDTLKRKVDE